MSNPIPAATLTGNVVEITQTPEPPDPESVILTIQQLRSAVVSASGLEQDDLDSLKVDAFFLHGETQIRLNELFPGTESAPKEAQLYVFQMFHGDQIDATGDHLPGDQRVYVLPVTASDPKAKEWRMFTFNRANPTMRIERMTQATFVEEVGGEWLQLFEAMNPEEEEVEGDAAATNGAAS